ncbi:MAG: hypothetical protein R6V62_04355 [Candidatus Fermentibacteraceae bacterium]
MNPFFCLLALTLAGPPDPASLEGCVVMLPGVPQSPWDGLGERLLEEMWTRDVTGYQVTLSGWSGYILMGPPGTAETLAAAAAVLVQGAVMPDTSGWARLLGLAWRENAQPCVLAYPFQPDGILPPLRYSALLSGEADTVIVSAPVANNVLLSTGIHDPRFLGAAWRGTGLEVIPSDWGGVPCLLAFVFQGSPGELDRLEYEAHPYDSVWTSGFGGLLAAVDSLAGPLAPTFEPSIVWIRGTGGATFSPWAFIPSPGPPLRSSAVVAPPQGIAAPYPWTPPPNAMRVDLPGLIENRDEAEQTAAVLERLVSRMVLVDYENGVGITGASDGDGRITLYFENAPWAGPEEALEAIREVIGPVAFTAPEPDLLSNCALRASLRLGRTVAPLSFRSVASCMAKAMGLL